MWPKLLFPLCFKVKTLHSLDNQIVVCKLSIERGKPTKRKRASSRGQRPHKGLRGMYQEKEDGFGIVLVRDLVEGNVSLVWRKEYS